jgi:protein TonB
MVYPAIAAEKNLQGKCFLQFVVEEDGSITNIKVLRGVPDCPEFDMEAVRIVKSMPKWKPGKIQGRAVRSYYTLPVAFNLN